jgi:quercetin dioxygenase-like cupin family protein
MRPTSITTVDAANKETIAIAGGTYTIITSGAETNGAYAAIEMVVPPGGGPIPHAHREIEESFYVLDGEVVFKSETQTYTAPKGSYIHIPLGGAVHCFKNKSDQPARLLCLVKPAGLDEFFKEAAAIRASAPNPSAPPTDEERKNIEALAVRYGQELFPPDYLDK